MINCFLFRYNKLFTLNFHHAYIKLIQQKFKTVLNEQKNYNYVINTSQYY